MAFALSPGGGTGVGERCHRGVCFLSGRRHWGGGEIGKALDFPLTVSRSIFAQKHPFLRYRVSALLTHPCY
jgi:hypothetical protein